jgi:hypothetical protein
VSVLLPGEGRLWAGKLIFDPGALGLGPTDVGDCIPEEIHPPASVEVIDETLP